MLSPEEAYKYDHTFRTVVDLMRIELKNYSITPAELRQAAILAATMHDSERIRPLFITNEGPAMFGGCKTVKYPTVAGSQLDDTSEFVCICNCLITDTGKHSQTCNDYNWQPLHQFDMPKLDGRAVTERRVEDRRKAFSTGHTGPERRKGKL